MNPDSLVPESTLNYSRKTHGSHGSYDVPHPSSSWHYPDLVMAKPSEDGVLTTKGSTVYALNWQPFYDTMSLSASTHSGPKKTESSEQGLSLLHLIAHSQLFYL